MLLKFIFVALILVTGATFVMMLIQRRAYLLASRIVAEEREKLKATFVVKKLSLNDFGETMQMTLCSCDGQCFLLKDVPIDLAERLDTAYGNAWRVGDFDLNLSRY